MTLQNFYIPTNLMSYNAWGPTTTGQVNILRISPLADPGRTTVTIQQKK